MIRKIIILLVLFFLTFAVGWFSKAYSYTLGFTEYNVKKARSAAIPARFGKLVAVDGVLLYFQDDEGNIRVMRKIMGDFLDQDVVYFPRS
ncbi:MAG: hypothetical protein ABIH01_03135 [Candidatus Omnitrophota bacterium]